MRTVFVISDVNGKNILPAKEFGDLRIMLTGKEDKDEAYSKLDEILCTECAPDDYILLIGSPLHIALASHIWLDLNGCANFLVWDREHYKYKLERIEEYGIKPTDK